MQVLDAKQTANALPRRALVETLREAFQEGVSAPQINTPFRHHHAIENIDESDASLLIMPAWRSGQFLGIKTVLVIPDNHLREKPAVAASYQLYSALSGELLAVIDGAELTNRRTAAASALASSYLSREHSASLLMVGAGSLAPHLIEAHCDIRPIESVKVWARDPRKAEALVASLTIPHVTIEAVSSLVQASREVDIISCATLSKTPLIHCDFVAPGTHIDLVGAFTPDMRESDSALIKQGSLFADTMDGVKTEGGDYIQAIKDGQISKNHIIADLFDLCRNRHSGRQNSQEITIFKSTGTALEDLAAATLALSLAKP